MSATHDSNSGGAKEYSFEGAQMVRAAVRAASARMATDRDSEADSEQHKLAELVRQMQIKAEEEAEVAVAGRLLMVGVVAVMLVHM